MDANISAGEIEKLARLSRQIAEAVESLAAKLPPIPDEINERIEKYKADKICLCCNTSLGNMPPLRGCHRDCYSLLNSEVNLGTRSDYQTILDGLWSPKNRRGRKKKRIAQPVIDKVTAKKKAKARKEAKRYISDAKKRAQDEKLPPK